MTAMTAALVISNTLWLVAWARARRRADAMAKLAATAMRNMVRQAAACKGHAK